MCRGPRQVAIPGPRRIEEFLFLRIEDQRGHLRLIHIELVDQPLVGLPPEVPQPDLPLDSRFSSLGPRPEVFRVIVFAGTLAGGPSYILSRVARRQRKFPLRGPGSDRGIGFSVSAQSEPVREPGFPRSTVAGQFTHLISTNNRHHQKSGEDISYRVTVEAVPNSNTFST